MKTFEQIAEIVLTAHDVDAHRTFLQHTIDRDVTRVARVPSSDAWQYRVKPNSVYRVFVRTEKNMAHEAQGPDLLKVIRECFEKVNLPLPEGL